MRVRAATVGDLPFLTEMILEAGFWRPDRPRPLLQEAVTRPDLAAWLHDWGRRDGDTGVVAVNDAGHAVGAAWYRLWTADNHAYGFIAPEIPELAIAVAPAHRGNGIGRTLLTELVACAERAGAPAISLSVEKANPARRLYRSLGFTVHTEDPVAYTMIRPLNA